MKLVEDKKDLISKYKEAKIQAKQKLFKAAEGFDQLNADLGLKR